MKARAHADNFQLQEFVKKKKKKRKLSKSNQKHENAETVEDPELGQDSLVLFEDAASQGGEARKKKKKLKRTSGKQQALMDNFFVRVDHEISNGTAAAAALGKKRRKKSEDSSEELSDVTSGQDCQEPPPAAAAAFKKPKKKKKKVKQPEADEVCEQPEADEVCEQPPCEKHSKGHKEKPRKKKKRRKGSAQGDREAEQPLLSPSGQGRGHRGWPSPAAEDGGCDAASTTSDISMELPADFSTPSKAAGRAKKTPHAKKTIKNSTFVVEENSSESDVMIAKALASQKKKQQQNNSFTELAAPDEVSVDGEEALDFTKTSFTDLDTARQELEEFIPHVKNISDSSIKKMAGRDLMRFKEFKKQGIAVRFGKFTCKENKQIQKNVEDFLSLTGIDSAEKLLFTSRFPEDKGTIHRLKTKHHFCEKISEGIPRPWRLIYYRARKMFDPNNYKGRYTNEEKEKLKKYQALHGNDWKKISELMSRSNLSVAMKFSEIKSAINYGPWTEEETQKLMNAVKEVMRRKLRTETAGSLFSLDQSDTDLWIDREQLYQPLPWTEIETKVGSRYWRQCKQKWNSILLSKLTRGQQLYRGTNGLKAKINLIKRLYETKAEDASEVNWDELSKVIGDVPGSYVQSKFYKLKVTSVPLWKRKTFSEIIDYLYEKKLPELEEKLRKEEGKNQRFCNLAARQQQRAFRFSDIFDFSENSDSDEERLIDCPKSNA